MSEAPELRWRLKPRLEKRSAITKHTQKQRAPSHVRTQAKRPEYVRIRKICDLFEDAASGDELAIRQAYLDFYRDLRAHTALNGKSLLSVMEGAKKMAELVVEQKTRIMRLTANPACDAVDRDEANKLMNCFPANANERDYLVYYHRVCMLENEVNNERLAEQEWRDEEFALNGITRVVWDSDDDCPSGVHYASTGGAGHGHGGPGQGPGPGL